MRNETIPPRLDDPLFSDKVIEEVSKGIDKGVKYAKIAIISTVLLSISFVGVVSWVVIHFILKSW